MYILLYKGLKYLDDTVGNGEGMSNEGNVYKSPGEKRVSAEVDELRSDLTEIRNKVR